MRSITEYRNGGEGFGLWVEDHICLPIFREGETIATWIPVSDMSRDPNPSTGRSYWEMWEEQKKVAEDALRMIDGKFIHRLIIFCWMRGEGKSLFACLIQLWKFFCFPRQQIMLGANSKEQTKFVHYDIMRDIILNSPKLLRIVGKRNVQEKEIRMRDKSGNIGSFIKSISSFSGIVSNVSGYTFSEMFDMNNPKFFVQLDGSIRNIPNALGVIDSTVSEKSHILYKLYQTYTRGEDPALFFHFRCSPEGDYKDFWNPQMTQQQLDSYKAKFPEADFARYFKNTWDAGSKAMFTADLVAATHYIGVNGTLGMQNQLVETIKTIQKIEAVGDRDEKIGRERSQTASYLQKDLMKIDLLYTLHDGSMHPRMTDLNDLQRLTDVYQTDWALCAGIDRADPLKINKMAGAKTIITLTAKGLPNSKNNPDSYLEDGSVKKYIYFLMHLAHVASNDLNDIKDVLKRMSDVFDGLDTLCSERWGMWDMTEWCSENEIALEVISPTYDRQRQMFSELYSLYKNGLFKAPKVYVPGAKGPDILEEEAKRFDHNPHKKWYGSPEKTEKWGIQDDAIYSLANSIYGGRNLGPEDFRTRTIEWNFGTMYYEQTKGDY